MKQEKQDFIQIISNALANALKTQYEENNTVKLVEVTEGAKALHVHPATLKRWIREGKVKNYSKGKKYLVNLYELTK